jgi:4-aminobutyrate aminotransferase-like enzyme
MTRARPPSASILDAPRVREAAAELAEAVHRELAGSFVAPEEYRRLVEEVGALRGRPLQLPIVTSGLGRGARVTLADGRSLLDFVGGIGVLGFGHADPDLVATALVAAASDAVFQGHLAPGPETLRLSRALLRHAGPRLEHAWLSVSGAMANENALKIVFQKRAPADRIVVFERGFAGRTLATAELTDKPEFREGLPLRGFALHVPFWDAHDPRSTARAVEALEAHLRRHPDRVAAMLFELVQGEGGIRTAPREFFAPLMERCRAAGVSVWVDEVQTFGRTGELFAFQTLGLGEWVDVVTVGKMIQGSAVLFAADHAPRPGLVAGTFAGASVGMAVGARIVERLEAEGFLGPGGRIAALGARVAERLDALADRLPRAVGARSGLGAMHGFTPFDGSPRAADRVVKLSFEEGLLLHGAGARPSRIRLLLPVNTTEEELDAGFAILEKALRRAAAELDVPC